MEECIMKDEYDFTKARKNPYAKKLKQQITINIDVDTNIEDWILTLLFLGCPSKFVERFVGEDRRIKLSEKLNFKELTQKSIRKNIIFTH